MVQEALVDMVLVETQTYLQTVLEIQEKLQVLVAGEHYPLQPQKLEVLVKVDRL